MYHDVFLVLICTFPCQVYDQVNGVEINLGIAIKKSNVSIRGYCDFVNQVALFKKNISFDFAICWNL